MSTQAQIDANIANSQLSSGPVSDTGKATSSRNGLRLGFRSATVILPGEDPAAYEALLAELTDHHNPVDLSEDRLVREMADAEWRLRRVRESLQLAITRQVEFLRGLNPDASDAMLLSAAIESLGQTMPGQQPSDRVTTCSYGTWLRYERKYENQYERADRDLRRLRRETLRDRDQAADVAMREVLFGPVQELTDQKLASVVQSAVSSPQTPRNASCPCGSGDKYKRCCGQNAPPVLSNAA